VTESLPNFLIIGAAKSGTTSLYYYLQQHPQIFMSPVKETNFFSLEGHPLNFQGPGDREAICPFAVTNWQEYRKLFADVTNEIAIGEASPLYLYHPDAPCRIKEKLENVKLIAILRNPVERAFSSFLHLRRDQREPERDFRTAISRENERIAANWEHIWHYLHMGFYSIQLKRYFTQFSPEQMKIYLYEDLQNDPLGIVKDICRFLEVDDKFIPDMSQQYNRSFIPRSAKLRNFLDDDGDIKKTIRQLVPHKLLGMGYDILNYMNASRPQLPSSFRRELIDVYRADILELADLLKRDLSTWLTI